MKRAKKDINETTRESAEDWEKRLDEQRARVAEWLDRHPPNPPNAVCHHAFIKGLSIINNFSASVGDYLILFAFKFETAYIWTHTPSGRCALVIDVDPVVKDQALWRTVFSAVRLALRYSELFEAGFGATDYLEYKWIYNFDPVNTQFESAEIYNTTDFDRSFISDGRVISASSLADLSQTIELFLRDERAYIAASLLNASFTSHYFCLTCAFSSRPFHDHTAEEPEIWEYLDIIPNLEMAIVNACRSVESILGEPPNRNNDNSLKRHKEKWKELTGINADETFEKSGSTYLDFYYSLFHDLRNPSAHSYGRINFGLERVKAVQAQCFAALILHGYVEIHALSIEEAKSSLHFNQELLERVSSFKFR